MRGSSGRRGRGGRGPPGRDRDTKRSTRPRVMGSSVPPAGRASVGGSCGRRCRRGGRDRRGSRRSSGCRRRRPTRGPRRRGGPVRSGPAPGRDRPAAFRKARIRSSTRSTRGPPRSLTRPAAGPSARPASRPATSRTSTGWNRNFRGTGATGDRPSAARNSSIRSWNWVVRRIVHGSPEAATTCSAASFER